jgi:hypothetical protein
MGRTKTAHQEKMPSPLDYVVKTLDERKEERCDYSFEMLTKLVLMAIGAKTENVLAASHWIHDHHEALFALGFRDRHERQRLPSQATLYRFLWLLEANIEKLERSLQHWAADVLKVCHQPGELLRLSVDGKQVGGSKRSQRGETALQLLSCLVHGLGLTLRQQRVRGKKRQQPEDSWVSLQGLMAYLGCSRAMRPLPNGRWWQRCWRTRYVLARFEGRLGRGEKPCCLGVQSGTL